MMFQMIGGLIGLGALSPGVVGLTLLMGRKSVREERQRQLSQRRQQAKAMARKYVDEVSFQVGKDSRDTLRVIQRTLRDGFLERVQELQQSAQRRLETTQHALESGAGRSRQRVEDIDAELGRLLTLADRGRAVAG
jgi:hypothetical protein